MPYALPRTSAEVQKQLDAIEKMRCEDSLFEFFKRAWREVDPAPLKVNWHHVAMCEHYEAVVRGEIRRLIVNIPPACGKSILTSVCLSAWIWIQPERGPLSGPQVKFLCVSYGQTLSEDLARLARRLVQSEWYQKHWGDRVRLSGEIARVDNFGTEAGGFRIASSMTGATLGRRGDIRIIDDPLSVDQAESKIERENVNKLYSEALQSRETDPSSTAEIIIMQRLHEDDLTGYILAKDQADVINIVYPMRFDPARACVTDWFADPRADPGELLWEEHFPEARVRSREIELGPYAFNGQYQQQPTPRGGGIFQREWIQPWPPLGPDGEILPGWILTRGNERRIVYPSFEFIMAAVDTGFTEKKQNDPSAMSVWGVFRDEGKSEIQRTPEGGYVRLEEPGGIPKAMCIWGWAKHLKLRGVPTERPPGVSEKEWASVRWLAYQQKNWGLVEWVIWTCKRWKVQYLRVETQGQGHNLEDEIRRELSENLPWTLELVPTKQDKIALAHSAVPIWSGGQVVLPQYEDGSFPTWLTPAVDEWCIFPRGRHDDQTDTMVASLLHMRGTGMLERDEEIKADETLAAQYERYRPVKLPYMS